VSPKVDVGHRRGFGELAGLQAEVEEGPPRFDYGSLSQVVAEQAQAAAYEIRSKLRRSVRDVIEIGERLIEIKPFLSRRFLEWIGAEFGMSDRSARNFMYVAERFGDKMEIISNLDITTVYLLAAPSTPDEVRWEVLERMELTDYKPNRSEVKEVIAAHKRPRVDGDAAAARGIRRVSSAALRATRGGEVGEQVGEEIPPPDSFRVDIDTPAAVSAVGSVSAAGAGAGPERGVAGEAQGSPSVDTRKNEGVILAGNPLAGAPARVCVEIDAEFRDRLVQILTSSRLAEFFTLEEEDLLLAQLRTGRVEES